MDIREYDKHMKYNFTLCYYETNRKITAFNLWENGIEAFRNSTFYREWDRIKNIDPQNINELILYVKDSIMEKTRIVTCFENFIKGQLILNEILVHKISQKHKPLASEQQERPIHLSEVSDEKTFKYLDTKKIREFDWKDYTIPFSWMLKSNYQSNINLPVDILQALKVLNQERNQLHFMKSIDFKWGPPVIEQYELLIHFVDGTINTCLSNLASTLSELRKES